MYFIGYFFIAIANIINSLLTLYMFIIIASVVLSWVNPNPYHPFARSIIRFIYAVTEPVFAKVRAKLPLSFGGIDFSPMLVIFAILLLTNWLVPSLARLGDSMLRS
jgi:YggT family protein